MSFRHLLFFFLFCVPLVVRAGIYLNGSGIQVKASGSALVYDGANLLIQTNDKDYGTTAKPSAIYIPFQGSDDSHVASNIHAKNATTPLLPLNSKLSIKLQFSTKNDSVQNKSQYYVAVASSMSGPYYSLSPSITAPVMDGQSLTIPFNDAGVLQALSGSGGVDMGVGFKKGNTSIYLYVYTADVAPVAASQITLGQGGDCYIRLLFSANYAEDRSKYPLLTTDVQDSALNLTYTFTSDSAAVYSGTQGTDVNTYWYTMALLFRDASFDPKGKSYNSLLYPSSGPSPVLPDKQTSKVSIDDPKFGNNFGSLGLFRLTNGVEYYPSVVVVNKYGFVSNSSAISKGTPLELEVFLKEQGCFLISASFQKHHYVLDYFRFIRDSYLLKTAIGTSFVHWYYSWSPYYAPVIINNPWLAQLIRTLAYTLYFGLTYFYYWFLPLLGVVTLLYFRKKVQLWKKSY